LVFSLQRGKEEEGEKCFVATEKTNGNYSAYAPDLPGCEDGLSIPPPRVSAEYLTT